MELPLNNSYGSSDRQLVNLFFHTQYHLILSCFANGVVISSLASSHPFFSSLKRYKNKILEDQSSSNSLSTTNYKVEVVWCEEWLDGELVGRKKKRSKVKKNVETNSLIGKVCWKKIDERDEKEMKESTLQDHNEEEDMKSGDEMVVDRLFELEEDGFDITIPIYSGGEGGQSKVS